MNLRPRQVHLDFHTSPHIPDVGAEFDPDAFASAVEAAHIASITIFAKCHHGMSYYPTKAGVMHPALKGRDMMGEQIEALHRRGIRCPLYVTVGWEEHSANEHLDWRQMTPEGHSVRAEPSLGGELLPGGWHFLNWLHPEYQDLMEAHIHELFDQYDVDGIFWDILFFDERAGWSPEARKFREAHGLLGNDAKTQYQFLKTAQTAFCDKFTGIIRNRSSEASIFYNAKSIMTTNPEDGMRIRAQRQSHHEIESLPSGHWGYFHFPKAARFVAQMGLPWLAMTGRFQKSWGDFGGIKPVPALEYECFRTQALGGEVSVGDQLPPRGKFDPAAIDLIGNIFAKVESAESFYEGSENVFDTGILTGGAAGCDWEKVDRSEAGAVLLCEAARRNAVLFDEASDLESMPALILPDQVVVTESLAKRLKAYYENGGSLILSHCCGFSDSGKWMLDFLPFTPTGPSGFGPTFWRPTGAIELKSTPSDQVIYSEGMTLETGSGVDVLVQRVLPYFQRSDARFCSHFQAPPLPDADPNPAVIAGERFLYFADPIFRDFRQSYQLHLRETWVAALEKLLGPPLVETGLPASIEVYPRRKGDDLLLTLLRYLPVKKSMEIDIIDEALPFDGESIAFSKPVDSLVNTDGQSLVKTDDSTFALAGRGRLLLTAPGFFS